MTWKDEARSAISGYLEGAWPTDSEEHAQLAIYIRDLLDENTDLLEALEQLVGECYKPRHPQYNWGKAEQAIANARN